NEDTLRGWVRAGGTLIAYGEAATSLCDKDSKLTQVRRRADVLDDLDKYAMSVKREREAGHVPVDEEALYKDPKPATAKPDAAKETDKKSEKPDEDTKKDDAKK